MSSTSTSTLPRPALHQKMAASQPTVILQPWAPKRLPLIPYPTRSYPAKLRLSTLALLVLGVGSLGLMWEAQHQVAVVNKTVGHDASPSVLASHMLSASVSRMNAAALQSELSNSLDGQAAWGSVETDRLSANNALINATQNITYGPITYAGVRYDGERTSIVRLQSGLENFLVTAGIAHKQGGLGGTGMWDMSQALKSDVLDPAEQLGGNNYVHLEQDYEAFSPFLVITTIALAFAVSLAMVVPSGWVRKETGSFSGRIAAGQVILLAMSVSVGMSLLRDIRSETIAKSDAFDSQNALARADVAVSDIIAQNALWLLVPEKREDTDIVLKKDSADMDDPASPSSKGGMMTQELANITFAGEQDAATATEDDWHNVIRAINVVRSLERSGQHAKAIETALSNKPEGLSLAFSTFEAHLYQTMSINQLAFMAHVAIIDANLPWIQLGIPLGGLVAMVLIFSGGMSRERMYS